MTKRILLAGVLTTLGIQAASAQARIAVNQNRNVRQYQVGTTPAPVYRTVPDVKIPPPQPVPLETFPSVITGVAPGGKPVNFESEIDAKALQLAPDLAKTSEPLQHDITRAMWTPKTGGAATYGWMVTVKPKAGKNGYQPSGVWAFFQDGKLFLMGRTPPVYATKAHE